MSHFTVERNPLRIRAEGATRAGLMVAALKGLFEAAGIPSGSMPNDATASAPALVHALPLPQQTMPLSKKEIATIMATEEIRRPFELTAESAPQLILAVLRAGAGSAGAHGDVYDDISFSLITDKKATGDFVGHPGGGAVILPAVRSIDGDIRKEDDGLWRATIALG